jgi:hypothetical protein
VAMRAKSAVTLLVSCTTLWYANSMKTVGNVQMTKVALRGKWLVLLKNLLYCLEQ